MTRLPLHDLHVGLGARFGEADGAWLPLDYGGPAAEHEAVRERVGLLDRSQRGVIEVTGRDRLTFLHALLSSDVKGLRPGQGGPAALLDVHGKIVAILAVHCLADRLLLETDRRLAGPLLAGLDRYLFSEKVELTDVTGAAAIVTLAGPAARKAAEGTLELPLPDLPVRGHVEVVWQGASLRLVRDEESGEEGYDVWGPPGALEALWTRAISAGARPVGRSAWNVLRVEAGVVWHGVDVDAGTLLVEAPLDSHYSLTKGCYVGQEVVARVTYRGHVNRKIVGLEFSDARIPAAGASLLVASRDVGRVTSPVVSPALRRGRALGWLRREHWEPGTRVEAAGPDGGRLAAEVRALPFYRREGSPS